VVLVVNPFNILSYSLQTDYRLIVPNIRGFGASTHPRDIQSSGSFPDLVGDMMCILEHASVSQAIVMGQVVFSNGLIRVCGLIP
jgi:pimeloyl-ACP methyl ester carboxylesterase